MSTPYLAAGPLAIDLNQPGTYRHWSLVNVSLANLIAVMVVIFGAALLLPFPKGKTYPAQQEATDPATGEPLTGGQAAATAEPASGEVLDDPEPGPSTRADTVGSAAASAPEKEPKP
jgi:hypothetical protein